MPFPIGAIRAHRQKLFFALAVASAAVSPAGAQATPVAVVAAENFYGDVAKQIGGADVSVTSILSNPDEDPHLFEASPSVARAISGAKIVIASGADYDPWVQKLLSASNSTDRKSIVVADLVGKKSGDNPHIWYDINIMTAFAKAFAADLGAIDPAHKAAYGERLTQFEDSLKPIRAKIVTLHARLAGRAVTATEPVFGYMLDALGLTSRNQGFQIAVMNNTEPSASDVAGFEDDLKNHKVVMLVYNSQASDPVAERMEKLAKQSSIPVVGATETEPLGKAYQQWMSSELDAVDHALPK
ncbi:MAG: zinc ABC transporter substrate-binding protein [Methylovirgula sp.]|uniref:metal ABC transporter solute-binding protein, Zn/Mn family n=1 Tax=Methylovirgula sp. TaxID=1978224 RepID=UPI003076863F